MATSAGTKVTTDPAGKEHPIHEGAGTVTSDSLAAESYNKGGDFDAPPGPQPSRSTTTNTTDTSNATTLPPPSERQPGDATYKGPPPGGKDAGVGPTYNARASDGPSATGKSTTGFGTSTSASGTSATAPGTSTAAQLSSPASGATSGAVAGTGGRLDHVSGSAAGADGGAKPKGKNLTEGGFDGSEPNASFSAEIGSSDDPGRAALGKLQRQANDAASDAAAPRDKHVEQGTGKFDAVGETSA